MGWFYYLSYIYIYIYEIRESIEKNIKICKTCKRFGIFLLVIRFSFYEYLNFHKIYNLEIFKF